MKHLKTTLLILLLVSSAALQSQEFSMSAGGGLNISKITNCRGSFRLGYQLGVNIDYAIQPSLSLQTGINLVSKGVDSYQDLEDGTVNAIYVLVPLKAAYRLGAGFNEATTFVFSAGPYAAYGIAGKTTLKAPVVGDASKFQQLEFETFSDNILKDFDFGLQASVGLEVNNLLINLEAQYGLTNAGGVNAGNKKMHNQSLLLSVGYRFYTR